MQLFSVVTILMLACAGTARAQFQLGNLTSTVLSYYRAVYDGASVVDIWDEDWRLLPVGADDQFVNIGIHYGTTILSAGGQGLIGGAGVGGSTHHTCYVGNLLPPTCMSQHWAASVGAQFGPGSNQEASGFEAWTAFTTDFGNAYIGFVIERLYEVDTNLEMVTGSQIEFDDYVLLQGDSENFIADLSNLLWVWSSDGMQVDEHPGGQNITYLEVEFKPILSLPISSGGLGNKRLKFTFMFANTFAKLEQAGVGQVDTSLTAKSMECLIEVLNWEYSQAGGSQARLAVEINFFSSRGERTTYGSDGITVVSTTENVQDGTARKRQTNAPDPFEMILPSEGVLSVWQAAGNWIEDANDVTYFQLSHRANQGGQLESLTIKQRRFDESTGKTKQEMKDALYDSGNSLLTDTLKTVWLVGQIYFNKFFDDKPLQQTASVYEMHAMATRPGVNSLKWSVGMGVGPYVNPYQTNDEPDINFPTCMDGIRNGGELDVDCGALCQPCESCDNGIKDQGEQLADCGGPNCPACDPSLLTGEDGPVPTWVWIIVAVVAVLLIGAFLCLVFFLVLSNGKKGGKHRHQSGREGSLRYGTSTTMGEVRRPSQRTGRSRASSRATLATERTPSRSPSQANLPSW